MVYSCDEPREGLRGRQLDKSRADATGGVRQEHDSWGVSGYSQG